MKHLEFQNGRGARRPGEVTSAIENIIANIGRNQETRATPRATELLFGCRMENFPIDNDDLWKLFNHLWGGSKPELIVTIAKNHHWANEQSASNGDLSFEVYPGEFLVITGIGADEAHQFISDIVTVGDE